MKIEAQDPGSIDGTPSQVATAAVFEAQEVLAQVRRYLSDVETQVRNAVMQDAVAQGLPRPYDYWEASPELRILAALHTKASTISNGLTLLQRVRAGQVTSSLPPESGSRTRAADGQAPESGV